MTKVELYCQHVLRRHRRVRRPLLLRLRREGPPAASNDRLYPVLNSPAAVALFRKPAGKVGGAQCAERPDP